ncbi:hypothetical protein BRC82_03240 [Halobacteriales archaeon QS_1_67_19]|nr:MAG: hypothetical protein BRC82_03240 [Halobacteriales archaeon QS_1_67_19]
MSPNVLDQLESVPSTTTLKRARWEAFEFTVCPNGVINVRNASYGPDATGHAYSVRLDDAGVPTACSCPHYEHRDASCKHIVAVASTDAVRMAAQVARNLNTEPASPATREISATPDDMPQVMTDGGRDQRQMTFAGVWHPAQLTLTMTVTDDPDDGDDTDDVPDECMCDGLSDDFPCWPCYRAGRKDLPADDDGAAAHSITGPHVEEANDGSLTGRAYYRCEDCGKEAMTRGDLVAFTCEG